MIYAEWTINGIFDNGIFPTWAAYYYATFNPDTIVKLVRVMN